jgi:hypothetical protein
MVQAALIGRPDVHARTLADACEPFELVDFRGVVEIEGNLREGRKAILIKFR